MPAPPPQALTPRMDAVFRAPMFVAEVDPARREHDTNGDDILDPEITLDHHLGSAPRPMLPRREPPRAPLTVADLAAALAVLAGSFLAVSGVLAIAGSAIALIAFAA